jgi:integrase/recombinase XerD
MSIALAGLAIQFLERQGLSQKTIRSYESTLMPLLQQYGRKPVDLLTRQEFEEYLNGLTRLSYTTHNRPVRHHSNPCLTLPSSKAI